MYSTLFGPLTHDYSNHYMYVQIKTFNLVINFNYLCIALGTFNFFFFHAHLLLCVCVWGSSSGGRSNVRKTGIFHLKRIQRWAPVRPEKKQKWRIMSYICKYKIVLKPCLDHQKIYIYIYAHSCMHTTANPSQPASQLAPRGKGDRLSQSNSTNSVGNHC